MKTYRSAALISAYHSRVSIPGPAEFPPITRSRRKPRVSDPCTRRHSARSRHDCREACGTALRYSRSSASRISIVSVSASSMGQPSAMTSSGSLVMNVSGFRFAIPCWASMRFTCGVGWTAWTWRAHQGRRKSGAAGSSGRRSCSKRDVWLQSATKARAAS
ncbi:hypothetical protein BC936DRAFT_147483 [Jimgerdemannia flammicorona]|uniref:Uncharacterized protein n=1 Tax=Jimgerdemannia flammicorona TaxID=994334 RepID=A0A433D585_9FUNG|nr:hypothetical protein BC936DRAFT_147483 [Jimgerdemannia flammicorona]